MSVPTTTTVFSTAILLYFFDGLFLTRSIFFDLMHRRELFNSVIRLINIISRAAYFFCFDSFFISFSTRSGTRICSFPVLVRHLIRFSPRGTTKDKNYKMTYKNWRRMKREGYALPDSTWLKPEHGDSSICYWRAVATQAEWFHSILF